MVVSVSLRSVGKLNGGLRHGAADVTWPLPGVRKLQTCRSYGPPVQVGGESAVYMLSEASLS
jgi:hypothetical protein